MHRTILSVALGAFAVAHAAVAQGTMAGMSHPYQAAFTVGATEGWTLGAPHFDLSGGLFSMMEKDGMPKMNEGFVSTRFQTGLGTQRVQLAGHALWVPKTGTSAQYTLVFQWVPTANDSKAYVSLGAGGVIGRWDSGNRGEPWAQAVVGWRTPIHDLSPFVQVGAPLVEGGRAQWLFGASHPLAPYKFHLP